MSSNKEISALIVDFLSTVVAKKQVQEEFTDSLNVAIDCITEAFEIERDDVKSIIGSKSLVQLLSGSATPAAAASSSTPSSKVSVKVEEDPKAKETAETLKLEGNKAMASKDFVAAISKYTAAIEAYPSNPIYYANRAAASSSLKDYESAVKDAELAVKVDPNYSKGYSRLGFAKYALDQPQEALEAYSKVLEIEGDKATAAMKKDYETAKAKVESSLNVEKSDATREASVESTNSASAADSNPFGGAGGMPDLSSFMNGGGMGGMGGLGGMLNNPQLKQAAQEMMKNPGMMQEMMSNPAIKQMAEKFSSGGGMPNFGDLMNDPSIKDMAGKMFGGQK